jgi:hypothetical protein
MVSASSGLASVLSNTRSLQTDSNLSQLFAQLGNAGPRDIYALVGRINDIAAGDRNVTDALQNQLKNNLSPLEQGQLAREIDNSFGTIANAKPQTRQGPQPAANTNAPLIGFQPGGVDWPTWIDDASKSAPGTPQRIAYDAMLRFGGSSDPKIVEMVMREVGANNVRIGEVRSAAGPLRGAEMRFRIGADLNQIKNQAAFEISFFAPAITALETKQYATPQDLQQAADLRALLQPAMNRFALASPNIGDLRLSGLVSGPAFANNLTIAEAYRKGGDDLARMGPIKGETVESIASAATRIIDARGGELFDKYIDASISAASLKYIPVTMAGENARSNIVRRLGASLEAIKIEIDPAKLPPLPFGNMDGVKADGNARFGNSMIEYATMQGLSAADKSALKDGAYEAVGREFYADTLGMMTAGLASAITAAARGPVTITADKLVKGKFMGTHNAGLQTPRFDKWTQQGGIVELMPGGQIRYTKMIDDNTVLSVTNGRAVTVNYKDGFPDFSPFMKHPSRVKSVKIEVTGDTRLDNIAANKAAGRSDWGNDPPDGWTWHHNEDGKTMMLIPREINRTFSHIGGASIARSKL